MKRIIPTIAALVALAIPATSQAFTGWGPGSGELQHICYASTTDGAPKQGDPAGSVFASMQDQCNAPGTYTHHKVWECIQIYNYGTGTWDNWTCAQSVYDGGSANNIGEAIEVSGLTTGYWYRQYNLASVYWNGTYYSNASTPDYSTPFQATCC